MKLVERSKNNALLSRHGQTTWLQWVGGRNCDRKLQ